MPPRPICCKPKSRRQAHRPRRWVLRNRPHLHAVIPRMPLPSVGFYFLVTFNLVKGCAQCLALVLGGMPGIALPDSRQRRTCSKVSLLGKMLSIGRDFSEVISEGKIGSESTGSLVAYTMMVFSPGSSK